MAMRKKTTAIPENIPMIIANRRNRLPSERENLLARKLSHFRPLSFAVVEEVSSVGEAARLFTYRDAIF
jgi:hypothetical protein